MWWPACLPRRLLLNAKIDLTRARRHAFVGREVTEIASGGRDSPKTDLIQYTILALAFDELPISLADIILILVLAPR